MRKIILIIFITILSTVINAQTYNKIGSSDAMGKIIAYFNRPVNNAVSTGTNAIYLNKLIDDTLIAYINRAKHTLDCAVYSFNESSGITSISAALNAAYSRGVVIRWIYDGSSSNPSISLLNSAINKLPSPTGMQYGLMHNKFMIIDANSANLNEPTVWTGSTNWTTTQINTDANNVIIIQDKDVAQAYTTEFNEMWGDTGVAPNLGNSKFGSFKTNNTPHTFSVGGTNIEIYFSPTDGTNSKLQQSIVSANTDMYFGIYSFTDKADADSIADRIQQHNVYVAGIIDPTSNSYPPYATLKPIMGANLIKDTIAGTGLYHNKMLIVDPSSTASDPLVFTGTHNWSASADTKNDENTIVVHSPVMANIYYQSFHQNFTDVGGGTLQPQSGIATISNHSTINVYPNPCNDYTSIKINTPANINESEISVFNILGKETTTTISRKNNEYFLNTKNIPNGLYFIKIRLLSTIEIIKVEVIH